MSTAMSTFFLPADLMEQAFASILERLDDEVRMHGPAEARYFAAQRAAFISARELYRAGLYPLPLMDDVWLMPADAGPVVVYTVYKHDDLWRCGKTCPDRRHFHAHGAYLTAIEQAMELAEQEDDTLLAA